MLYQGNNSYNLNSCEVIEVFYNIRTDLDKLNYAVHITKMIQDVTDENQNTYKILQLFLNTLYMISELITECTNCGQKERLTHFSLKDSGFKCEACSKQDSGAIKISEGTKTAIQYIIMAPPKKLFSFELSEESQKELELVSKLYLNDKLDKEYKMDYEA